MFYYISGKLMHRESNLAVLDVGGVGYKLTISGTTYEAMPPRSHSTPPTVKLFTYLAVREDDMELFGFATQTELASFKMLISVSGVGPKAAMSILSLLTPEKFAMAVCTDDRKTIAKANGIGPKTAARIILELKDKMGGTNAEFDFSAGPAVVTPAAGNNVALATAALQELGYSPAEVATALKGADPKASTEELVRHALRAMVMKGER